MSPKYFYDKRTGWYKVVSPVVVPSVAAPSAAPRPDSVIAPPSMIHTALGDVKVGSRDYEAAKTLGLLGSSGNGSSVVANTGSGSDNQAKANNNDRGWIDLTNLVNVVNKLQSNAKSGNVNASANTQVGNAVTGTASAITNVLNLLASAWSWANGNLNFFTQTLCDFNQTCNGDINLKPIQADKGGGQLGGSAAVNNTGSSSNNDAEVNKSSVLDVNAKNSGNIVNNVDLNAQSGDAKAMKNTSAGNVATGNAIAEANIINMINSFINSGSSFFGVLNVFGNLKGDILFPDGFLNGSVASGGNNSGTDQAVVAKTGPGSDNQAMVNNNNKATINNSAVNAVNNNISTTAESGAASATSNTTVGKVSSGLASTAQGLFNLANSSILGDNAVLVIVNVLGHWVGKIMSLPGGGTTQSALLTGNAQVNSTGPDSKNQALATNTSAAHINQSSFGSITNNVNVRAKSGDASADKNTKVGDVSTGNAQAASNVANIFNSILNVKHWFGVLVVNVFGDWQGDVNNDTAAGGKETKPSSEKPGMVQGVATAMPPAGVARRFAVTPGATGVISATGGNGLGAVAAGNALRSNPQIEAVAKVLTAAAHEAAPKVAAAAKGRDMSILFGISTVVMLIAGVLASIGRKLKRR